VRASNLPSAKEIVDSLERKLKEEQGAAVLTKAVRAAELFGGLQIRPRRISQNLLVGLRASQLDFFPVQEFKCPLRRQDYFFDTKLGILEAFTAPERVKVSYRIGFEEGEWPALTRELVLELARFCLSPTEDRRDYLRQIIEVCKRQRQSLEAERNEQSFDREVVGQRPN